jgi:hypothetical protein
MESKNDIQLTSAEIGNLWTVYIGDTASICQLKYALKIMQDEEIRPLLQNALELSQKRVKEITDFFNKTNHPIPIGFTDADVDLNAPRLYSDAYLLAFAQNMAETQLNTFSMALTHGTRLDIRLFFTECIASTTQLFNQIVDLMLAQGIYVRPPFIPIPKQIDMVEKQSYLTGWFGNRRPLNATELEQLFFNVHRNAVGEALLLGYSQVAKLQEVRDYMRRGVQIAKKLIKVFGTILMEEDIPAPMIWASTVEASTISPFSDKLMMFQVAGLTQAGFAYYARAQATSMRRDLATHYFRILTETAQYAEDGANITIENAWLEEPPQVPDRKQLAIRKK